MTEGAAATAVEILLLEDDSETARTLRLGLRECGYEVAVAGDAGQGLRLAQSQRFDAAILDLMVPEGSGFDVLRELRRDGGTTPVLIVTARDSVAERVDGLERGADDYLVKPFAFAELLARLRALLRRPARRFEPLAAGPLELDPVHRRAHVGGRRVELTRTEFDLLLCMLERRGEVLTRRHLLELVWGYRFDTGTNVVEVHLARLRRKLESAGASELIRTVRGVGYVLAG
jgi:two-component system copper resistance phosphate regulon response regulator CusR